MKDQAMEIASAGTAASAASKVTYGGSAAAMGGWFLSNEFAVLMGLVIGVAGFVVNWYYRHKEYKLKERESLARLSELVDD
jgi:predicted negative regulator of RcsB-dependent stress response